MAPKDAPAIANRVQNIQTRSEAARYVQSVPHANGALSQAR